jgi:hypothetical protein
MTTLDFSKESTENFESREGIPDSVLSTVPHEMSYAFDYDQGKNADRVGKSGTNSPTEKPAVDFENRARNLINLPKEQHMEAYHLILIRYLFILTILTSCSKEKEINYYKTYSIERKKNEPIKSNYYMLFCKNSNEQICVIEPYEISYIYKKNKIIDKYDVFFNDILNQKISMKADSTDHICFEIDKKIENDNEKLDRNNFLLKYAYKSADKKRYLINNKLVGDNNLCVAYFLFKSGFGITFDDYLGSYYVNDLTVDY